MGYTHYLELSEKGKIVRDQQPEIVQEIDTLLNLIYLALLRNIEVDGQSLDAKFADPAQRDDYFHEYNADYFKDGKVEIPAFYKFPMKGEFMFCKTARKEYDPVIYTLFHLIDNLGLAKHSYDGNTAENPVAYFMGELDYDGIKAKNMAKDIEDVLYKYDSQIEALREKIAEVEDESQYSCMADISETDLEYIAENIKKGNTTIYLDRGVVRITLVDSNNSYN